MTQSFNKILQNEGMEHRIAIVGGGYCGTVLAAHLLRHVPQRNTSITLIERAPEIGRGVAYARHDRPYLLNVPAGRLSADSREPLQFLRFAQQSHPGAGGEDFLPRELYGDYLQAVLQRAEGDRSPRMSLARKSGEVIRIARAGADADAGSGAILRLQLANGESVSADQVVLAVGDLSPATVPWAEAIADHPAYRSNPWIGAASLGCDQTMVVVGSGLTMADVAASAALDTEHSPRIISISRHGLMPLPQSHFNSAVSDDAVALAVGGAKSLRELSAIIRRLAVEAVYRGGDWREVITSVRASAPSLWQRLPQAERRRFLRHARIFWDIHRHRMPTELAAKIGFLRRTGKLQVNAGRVVAIEPIGRRLAVKWRRRGSEDIHTVEADLVVNATGPGPSLSRCRDVLLKALQEAGWITEDDLSLGLRTATHGACINVVGAASDCLFYLGPMLRAAHWEATAATELRDHAARLAAHLLAAH